MAGTGLVRTCVALLPADPPPPGPTGVATSRTLPPGASPPAGSTEGRTATGTRTSPASGGSLVVSSDAASSVPGRSDVAATRPITWESWLAGITWTPGPAATVVVPMSVLVTTDPAYTGAITMSTGT